MIIYIHGFGGCGLGVKARAFRDFFKSRIVAPSLPYQPNLAIDTLEQIINAILPYEKVFLIGSSLGGFYALNLANRFNLKCVLINPALSPQKTLKEYVGNTISYYDKSFFNWTPLHVKELEQLEVGPLVKENCMVLLQKGDELLDWNESVNRLHGANIVLEEGGSHSFDGIERYFDHIDRFFR